MCECDCGVKEFPNKICYVCGLEIEYGEEIFKDGVYYHKHHLEK